MRGRLDTRKLEAFMQAIGQRATTTGVVYLVGGATALLLRIREQTIDVDIKLDPEPGGIFETISALKNSLQINVKLAAQDQFLPPLPGWRERSPYIQSVRKVVFRHYDFYSQVLSKIERGHAQDLGDAREMMIRGGLNIAELVRLAAAILPDLPRYPAIDPEDLQQKLRDFVRAYELDRGS